MAAIACASLILIYKRLPDLQSERPLDSFLSRESAFLFNNLIMVVACFSVLWGTMFPVLSEYVQGNKISVGAPFFNRVNIPIGLFLLLLMGVGPLFAWRKTSLASLRKAFFRPATAAALACAAVTAGGVRSFYATVCFSLCAFVAMTVFEEFYKGARVRMRNHSENFAVALVNLTLKNRRRYGGYIVHVAIVLIFVGLAGNAFNIEQNQMLSRGEEMKIGRYTLKLTDYKEADTANYRSGTVTLQAFRDDRLVRTLRPERRAYRAGDQQTTTEVALYSTPKEDLYAVFAGTSEDGRRFQINAFVNPLVWWVWFGAGVMFLGTLLTLLPDRKAAAHSAQPLLLDTAVLEQSLKLK
jgi:cytochrome c-type biogenesis protein CcmF